MTWHPHYGFEKHLGTSIRKLGAYMPASKGNGMEQFGEGAASIGTAGISAQQAQAARNRLIEKQLAAQRIKDEAQQGQDVEFIKGYSPNSPVKSDKYETMMGNALPPSPGFSNSGPNVPEMPEPRSPVEIAQDSMRNNALADQTRMGGVYSPNGLQKAQEDARLNASDRMRFRGMIGLGGSERGF